MKFIAPILAILVCAAAAYFSFTMSEKFQATQDARLLAIETNKQVTATADKADSDIVDEKALLETSKNNLEVATQSVIALESTGNALKNESAKLDAEIAAQDSELAELNKAIEEVQKVLGDLGGDVTLENLPEKVNEISEDIKTRRAKLEELETLVDGAKSTLSTKQAEVQRLVERKDARSNRIARNAMEARVTAVDHDWGFLVIGAGSNSGFTPQTSLLVKRDGRLIAKVNPSAIEPTQTIAEIDLKALSPGVRIQPGDSVILAKPSSN
ncbi:hypothetical protein HZ994_14835 [Akkermansiaceae bacterium]|nr:hypothetical protein HZ994_14835 [Akkermansiaceae bacterium]